VSTEQSAGTIYAPCLSEKVSLLYCYPFSLKKKDNSVGSVGSVGKSEKSPENFPRKVFQNAYTDYTNYTDLGLEL